MARCISFICFFVVGWMIANFVTNKFNEAKYGTYVHGCKENSQKSNMDCHLAARKFLSK